MAETCRFTAELWRWAAAQDAWFFVTLPDDASALVRERPRPRRGFGSVRVEVTVGTTTWRTSVFPDSGSGRYVLPVKKAVRTAEDLEEGEPVDVRLSVLE
ncbi:DUF1905 domain-containing protein [Ornithinimicrobium pekingense]|uniref:DUF1905 domain-containing protein n=1 Tax=Ornithinimicrobium pekingense TaxID=384677 RepID=A0ABQ2F718_9MICO|nr:DUF1905 domain-containing protein [Ornithinimicrobium pekingense]GGK68292.1 hypothetical protein GCM10011509_15860 [Ornithinimicrobium pekingense]